MEELLWVAEELVLVECLLECRHLHCQSRMQHKDSLMQVKYGAWWTKCSLLEVRGMSINEVGFNDDEK